MLKACCDCCPPNFVYLHQPTPTDGRNLNVNNRKNVNMVSEIYLVSKQALLAMLPIDTQLLAFPVGRMCHIVIFSAADVLLQMV